MLVLLAVMLVMVLALFVDVFLFGLIQHLRCWGWCWEGVCGVDAVLVFVVGVELVLEMGVMVIEFASGLTVVTVGGLRYGLRSYVGGWYGSLIRGCWCNVDVGVEDGVRDRVGLCAEVTAGVEKRRKK